MPPDPSRRNGELLPEAIAPHDAETRPLPQPLAAVAQLGQYRVIAQLGAGGMGQVFLATDTVLHREVAIKVLSGRLAHSPEQLARFEREAQMLAALNHPNIATLFDLVQSGESRFLVMEYVSGETLAQRIARGPVPLREALTVCAQVAEALEAAHRKGITHRDVKPANIMVTPEGRVKVLDFGLAKTAEGSAAAAGPTQEGQILGTPAYMSPEQIRGKPLDHRSDIWAFGCVLFELLSGQRPFGGETVSDALAKVLEREPDWRSLPSSTPAAILDLLRRCLRKDPAQRLPQIAEARRRIEATLHRRWRVPRRHLTAAAVSAALIFASIAAWWIVSRRPSPVETLAIFPFANAGGSPDTEYLSQGVSESLISSLSRTSNLKVLSRDSAFRYPGQSKDVREIGRDLGVSAVLRGRLLQRGNEVSVSVELVRARDGTLIWRQQYDRPAANLLDIQQDIARQLPLRLTGREQTRPTAAPSTNPEAYRLYLQGRYYWNRRSEDGLRKSAEAFQQAIDKDPGSALAWAGLADSFLMLGAWSVLEPKDAYPRAKAAATRAIALDASLAEPHATLGYFKTLYEWDWPGAGREFRQAIDLQPEYGTAHHWYAFYFLTIGDIPQSLSEIERAREIDPLSPVVNTEVSHFYVSARQYPRALLESRKMVELDPSASYPRLQLAEVYALLGRRSEAVAELQHVASRPYEGVILLSIAAVNYGLAGQHDKARELLAELNRRAQQRYVYPALIAKVYAVIGEHDRAFEYLNRSLDDRSLVASWLRGPDLDSLRADPRFKALFDRLGLKI